MWLQPLGRALGRRAARVGLPPRPHVHAAMSALAPAALRRALGTAAAPPPPSAGPVGEPGVTLGGAGAPTSLRTHSCGALREAHGGHAVTLCGWVSRVRAVGTDLVFVTLRDAFGTTQVLVAGDAALVAQARALKPETVLQVKGTVAVRPPKMRNKNMATGAVEVAATGLDILNTCLPLPFPIDNERSSDNLANEALRLRHRYVDLRRDELQQVLRLRSRVAQAGREFLGNEHGFVEVETPTLFKRTPGGAAEFPVPTRERGQFYTLVQSPQQFKQLLMVGGIDRYYQFARCYRDESGRGDRQPEFTQIDLELSFVTQHEIQTLVEGLVTRMWAAAAEWPAFAHVQAPQGPFLRMSYAEAMRRFGVDKPDMRFGMELTDVTPGHAAGGSGGHAGGGGPGPVVLQFALPAPLPAADGEALVAELRKAAGDVGGGPAFVVDARAGTVAAAGPFAAVAPLLGRLRLAAAAWLEARGVPVRAPGHRFLWVEDFPLFERDEHGRLQATHHPFTAPVPGDAALLYTAPERARAQHFDLVVNGVELGGGSVRVHHAPTQEHILGTILGEDLALFEQLLEGLRFGAPPHGGLALGFDRVMMVLCGAASLRDVLAFPKSFAGKDLMAGVPGPLAPADLAQYHLRGERGDDGPAA